jgi:hypothetical protein
MISGEEYELDSHTMPLRIVWRNPRTYVRACLRARQAKDPYCRWGEQASKIRSRRSNGDTNNSWIDE